MHGKVGAKGLKSTWATYPTSNAKSHSCDTANECFHNNRG